jgi:hypothetical protein
MICELSCRPLALFGGIGTIADIVYGLQNQCSTLWKDFNAANDAYEAEKRKRDGFPVRYPGKKEVVK